MDKALGNPFYLLDFLDARRDFLFVHIRYFKGYQYFTCLQDTIQSSHFAMSSLPSSVAAHATATCALSPPAWFQCVPVQVGTTDDFAKWMEGGA